MTHKERLKEAHLQSLQGEELDGRKAMPTGYKSVSNSHLKGRTGVLAVLENGLIRRSGLRPRKGENVGERILGKISSQ